MPVYTFVCQAEHATDHFVNTGQRRVKCGHRGCRRIASYNATATFRGGGIHVTPDVPEHYNVSLGERVRGRRHLKQLQEKHGCQDWEPVRDGPHLDHRAKAKRQGRRIA